MSCSRTPKPLSPKNLFRHALGIDCTVFQIDIDTSDASHQNAAALRLSLWESLWRTIDTERVREGATTSAPDTHCIPALRVERYPMV